MPFILGRMTPDDSASHSTDGEEFSGDRLHQPHDKLFTAAFGVPENAAALLRSELPRELADAIDWHSLRLEPGSFVDARFRQSHTDLLFSANIGGSEALLYILFEHQSSRDPRLPLRLLGYMANIWDQMDRRRSGLMKLPPILPVVISQNAELWDVPECLAELLDLPRALKDILRPFIPDFHYRHLQLAAMDYETIPGTSSGILVLRVMKAERLGELLSDPMWDESLLVAVPPEIFEMVLRYILGRDIDKGTFEARIEEISNPQIRSTAMTLAQVYRQEGLEKGMERGHQKGRQASILETLECRFGSIPTEIRDAVARVESDGQLRALNRAAIQSASLAEFAKHL